MASLTDVARTAEVSIATASIVLSGGPIGTRVSAGCVQRVRDAAVRLGYVANYHARSMKSGRADAIAVPLDFAGFDRRSELGTGFYGALLGGIELAAREAGSVTCLLGATADTSAPERCFAGMRQRRFDGAVMPGTAALSARSDFLHEPLSVPVALVHYAGPTEIPVTTWDEAAGVALAAQHLAGLGHRDVLWLGPVNEAHPGFALRETAFLSAASAAGLRARACRFAFGYRDPRDAEGREAPLAVANIEAARAGLTRGLADLGAVTAIACYNDATAVGACAVLAAAGIAVPAAISVIGIDDLEAAFCVPRLTTVSQRVPELGRRACAMVLRMIREPGALDALRGHREVVQPELVLRASTAPPRG